MTYQRWFRKNKTTSIMLLLVSAICFACTGGAGKSGKGETSLTEKRDESPSAQEETSEEEKAAPDGGDGEGMPTEPEALKERARYALRTGNIDEAMAIIDVLLVMQPNDLEMIELRGDTLLNQGHAEDGNADLKRCCDAGRKSCCR